jgi:hypothetical protein
MLYTSIAMGCIIFPGVTVLFKMQTGFANLRISMPTEGEMHGNRSITFSNWTKELSEQVWKNFPLFHSDQDLI